MGTIAILHILRGVLVLPHNEVYQNAPTGKHQNHFVLGQGPSDARPTVFWSYAGEVIATRLKVGCRDRQNLEAEIDCSGPRGTTAAGVAGCP